jgi:catechol 2,3-dioxygenase-like lactoylglutathione lyase family enzyme
MEARFSYAIAFVADMDKAVAFHRDVLGLTLRFASPFWSEFATGDVTLALHPASAENPAGNVQLGFTVEDVAKLYQGREENGLDFSSPPRTEAGSLLARIRNSEGADIGLSS